MKNKKMSLLFLFFTILMSMVSGNSYAYDFAVENDDGVTFYYNYINDGKDLEVVGASNYSNGTINIPEKVTYMGRTRSVTSIGEYAFGGRSSLTSVTIPNSVTSIGNKAFEDCHGLTSVTIGNSVTYIGYNAFYYCSGLTSVNIHDIAAWCKIYFMVDLSNPLYYAHHLYLDGEEIKDLVIPNSVTRIGNYAFKNCSGLTSVVIPNSVTSIGSDAFHSCSGLTSVVIGNSVTLIGSGAFYKCSGLTSVVIPNSVTSIYRSAFAYCSGLTSVVIGNSVTNIENSAFDGDDLTNVTSMITHPFHISNDTFTNNTYFNATLNVPDGTTDLYKSREGWQNFTFIEESSGSGSETPKCAMPTISYNNGKLTFASETEGATCLSTITDSDISFYTTDEVLLGVTYTITVYATKAGYENSGVATATLCWIESEPKTEGLSNNVSQVYANAALIQSYGGTITITGVEDGTPIEVYAVSGEIVGTAHATGNFISLTTNLKRGEIAIVKIGKKSVKVIMQ